MCDLYDYYFVKRRRVRVRRVERVRARRYCFCVLCVNIFCVYVFYVYFMGLYVNVNGSVMYVVYICGIFRARFSLIN